MFLPSKLQQLRDEFAHFDDPQERLSAVVDRSRRLPRLPAAERTDANRVKACISPVWIIGATAENRCQFRGDAESPVVRGLVTLLCEFFSNAPAHEVAASELDPLEALGLLNNLSPTRRNGLASARARIRELSSQISLTQPREEAR